MYLGGVATGAAGTITREEEAPCETIVRFSLSSIVSWHSNSWGKIRTAWVPDVLLAAHRVRVSWLLARKTYLTVLATALPDLLGTV